MQSQHITSRSASGKTLKTRSADGHQRKIFVDVAHMVKEDMYPLTTDRGTQSRRQHSKINQKDQQMRRGAESVPRRGLEVAPMNRSEDAKLPPVCTQLITVFRISILVCASIAQIVHDMHVDHATRKPEHPCQLQCGTVFAQDRVENPTKDPVQSDAISLSYA